MNVQQFDIIEVVLKQNLKIKLTEEETRWLENIDEELKNTVIDLISDESYLDDIISLLDRMIQKASLLPLDEQADIKQKCIMKKRELEETKKEENKKLS